MKKNIKTTGGICSVRGESGPRIHDSRALFLKNAPLTNTASGFILNALVILCIIGLLVFNMSMFTNVYGAPGDAQDVNGRCVASIKSFMEIRREEFGKFMNEHFRSAKPTSDLIPITIDKFREYREEVEQKVAEFLPAGKSFTGDIDAERDACAAAAETDFGIMKEIIRAHILENAYAKKTTRLLDKYKEINGKLEKLNFTIGQLYGYFGAFSQKLPCYATQCKKG